MKKDIFKHIITETTLMKIQDEFRESIENCTINDLWSRFYELDIVRSVSMFGVNPSCIHNITIILQCLEAHYVLDRLVELGAEPLAIYDAGQDMFYYEITSARDRVSLFSVIKRNDEFFIKFIPCQRYDFSADILDDSKVDYCTAFKKLQKLVQRKEESEVR